MKSDFDFTPNIHMIIKPKINLYFGIVIIFVNLNIIIIQIYSEVCLTQTQLFLSISQCLIYSISPDTSANP